LADKERIILKNSKLYAGIDVGASTTKAIVINSGGQVLGSFVTHSGANFKTASKKAFDEARIQAGGVSIPNNFIVSTGYGRRNVDFSQDTKTEISCHARGSYFHYPHAHTLIDIGGQDSKIIKMDSTGRRTGFKMNRKCAAGTGAFLEEMSNRLKVDIEQFNSLAKKSRKDIQIGSYCTVFSATEILTKIREGIEIEDLVKGVFDSIIKRAAEMDVLDGNIVMSGGVVAHNPYLVKMFEERIEKTIFVPPLPQLTGAFGAALYASEKKE
jgi:predicted CoA-substrate-specific enzyme activase